MNYLRGAVSAISAPYQYYKDINPATLTGAIDVIVVSRPKQQPTDTSQEHAQQVEGNELVCSPFHVRFGKWQVLRPGDKKVNLFVNGDLVPFPMKIGEAGEAFFVFETDEDVPEDLVTSPLLEATKPGQTNADVETAGRFGAQEGPESTPEAGEEISFSQEPDFLDLNASGSERRTPEPRLQDAQEGVSEPSLFSRTAHLGKTVVEAAIGTEKVLKDKLKEEIVKDAISEVAHDDQTALKKKAIAAQNGAENLRRSFLEGKGDEVLPDTKAQGPEVVYANDMVFDMEGYHSHERGRSGDTVALKHGGSPSSEPSTPGSSRSPSPSASSSALVPFPTIRAKSEPPPEHETRLTPSVVTSSSPTSPPTHTLSDRMHATQPKFVQHRLSSLPASQDADTEEYMWDWGSFPQRTPIRTAFPPFDGSSVKEKGKERMVDLGLNTSVDRGGDGDTVVASPLSPLESDGEKEESRKFGEGGRIGVDRRDPTRFRVSIEGRTVDFELSVIPGISKENRTGEGPLGGENEVMDPQRFDGGKIDFQRFLDDERVVKDPDLTMRWAGDTYITRKDASPLFDALIPWREAALRGKLTTSPSRSPSPGWDGRSRLNNIEEEAPYSDDEQRRADIAKTTANTSNTEGAVTHLSSSSWVRWWSRSRRTDNAQRPGLRAMNTAPSTLHRTRSEHVETVHLAVARRSSSLAPPSPVLILEPEMPASEASSEEEKPRRRKRYAKTLRLTSDQLKSLKLKSGANSITFSLSATGAVACTARLFVWKHTDQVVVSDIDGTITKSDALGHVFTMIGRDWTHLGVAKLYTDICRNGYKILYLTSRAIGQADTTRDYLKGIRQNDYQLPEGPVIMSPDRLLASFHREVILRKPEVFKMAALRDIQKLFGNTAKNPFYAGFGNRITDALSYRSVNIPSSRIFTIDSSGEVKMELLELAGYKSSYIHMTDLVDQMFPPINKKWAAEYTDFNFWKPPIQEFALPDLSPPSPALSARSDTSNQSALARLRHFSLGGGRQANNMSKFTLPPPATATHGAEDDGRKTEMHLRQMSSFERLSSTLVGLASPLSSPRSSTPTFIDSGSEDEDYEGDLGKQKGRRRQRRESMPGSLPGSDGSVSDDDLQFTVDDHNGYEYDSSKEDEAANETFDEDLLAAGEMEKVPFL
ncbi:LNS2-domain-containing protein [Laetiporus sulphureus 93-53]|uniref:phosphatidate phosphatase n=1 Tax=Laetiporus sulphureus 93-53 TaxID=1314785 RepID=A0A165DU94_9APHY|nr:LNS2-domain-containing protein [Laetiporus sulphureus 93-53]KZT05643.1 LNS2-domain-containing protein [Laetiporus sulphureus 93-53]